MKSKETNHSPLTTFSTFKKVFVSGLLEFGPVVIFLTTSHFFSIFEATIFLMITTIISTFLTHHTQKRIPYTALYVALITLVFGYMTIHYRKVKFIQMRDTLYDLTCALTLIVGIMMNVPILKIAFDKILTLKEKSWDLLTHMWIFFFISLAVLNEIVRRHFPLHTWIHVKSYVIIVTSLFVFLSVYIVLKKEQSRQQ